MNKEQREKPYFLRRIVAYLIDLIFVLLLVSAIAVFFVDTKKSQSYTEELVTLSKKFNDKEITQEEYTKQAGELNYLMAKESIGTTIINCSVALVYYVVLCYFCHGITLGKYIMKLQIISANDKKLNMGNLLLRGLFVNLILSNLLTILFIYAFSKDTYINVYSRISQVLTLFLLVTILFITYRNDGRGLHDLMSNTKVISTKEPKNKEIKEEVVEANVIEEKHEEKSTSKKTTKKTTKKTGGKK